MGNLLNLEEFNKDVKIQRAIGILETAEKVNKVIDDSFDEPTLTSMTEMFFNTKYGGIEDLIHHAFNLLGLNPRDHDGFMDTYYLEGTEAFLNSLKDHSLLR